MSNPRTMAAILRDPWRAPGFHEWLCAFRNGHQWWHWQGYVPPFPSQRWGWYLECQQCGVREVYREP